MTSAATRTPGLEGPPGFEQVTFCGAGATSRVFRAVESRSGRVVALKRLHRQLVKDGAALARLKRELQALRLLRHEVLVQVAGVISWAGDPTLVMDFIAGEDLKEIITRRGRLTAEETERIARSLFSALSLTHASGIVHRDIKPQNVRLTHDGGVYLLDFGSARLDAASQLTTTGTTVGTPEYMPPELFAGPVYDPRVDVYGVGATLYECLTGSPPQSADSLAELAHLRASVDILPVRQLASDAPVALSRVIDRCLARAPGDRFPSAALASWSLDNPLAERALAARRSSHPLCLHCGAPIPKESATCATCRSRHPFRYELGPAHVVIRSVENVARFIEHVAIRFPDLASPGELQALAERGAALSFAGQRYVSFVTDPEARAIVAELAEIGARADVVLEPSWWQSLVRGLVFPLYFPIRIPLALLDGAGSILSPSRAPRPSSPRMTSASWTIGVLALAAVVSVVFFPSLLHRTDGATAGELTDVLATILASAAAVLAVSLGVGFRRPRIDERRSPQPSGVILFATPPSDKNSAAGAAPFWMLGVTVLLMLGECIGLGVLLSAATPSPRLATHSPRVFPIAAQQAAKPGVHQGQDPADRDGKRRRGPDGSYAAPAAPAPFLGTAALAQLASLGLGAVAIGAILRRRRRIRRDAAAIVAELDLSTFAALAQRSRPDRVGRRLPHALSNTVSHDAFVAEAIRRASDLMPLLGGEHAARLAASIEALITRDSSAREADRSLLARCILETDPRHKLRLDLLAIEGQLEAYAASEWLLRIEQLEPRGEPRLREEDEEILGGGGNATRAHGRR